MNIYRKNRIKKIILYRKNQTKKIIFVLRTRLSRYRIKFHTVKLYSNDNSIGFKINNYWFFGKKYLIIKHRNTGKRISKLVSNSDVELCNDELIKMGEFGIFDIYLKVKIGRLEFIERTKYNSINNNNYLINKKERTIFSPYKTNRSDLSFKFRTVGFSHEITFSRSNQNHVHILGVLNLFEDIPFDSIEFEIKSKKIHKNKLFKCEYEKKGNSVHFKVEINLEIIEKYLDTNYKLSIRLKNNDIIVSKEVLEARI